MTNYRRNYLESGSYFFTVALAKRSEKWLVDHIENLKVAISRVKKEKPFILEAMVVLPDHLHCIWTLPTGDADYPTRWKMLKAYFSKTMPKGEERSKSRQSKGERGIWQRRYWEHTLRDDNDWQRYVDYIHYNPVKHGYVTKVKDWPHSTFHKYVQQGVYTGDWGGADGRAHGEYGEV